MDFRISLQAKPVRCFLNSSGRRRIQSILRKEHFLASCTSWVIRLQFYLSLSSLRLELLQAALMLWSTQSGSLDQLAQHSCTSCLEDWCFLELLLLLLAALKLLDLPVALVTDTISMVTLTSHCWACMHAWVLHIGVPACKIAVERQERMHGDNILFLITSAWMWHVWFLFTFYWPGINPKAPQTCRGIWEMQYLFFPQISLQENGNKQYDDNLAFPLSQVLKGNSSLFCTTECPKLVCPKLKGKRKENPLFHQV